MKREFINAKIKNCGIRISNRYSESLELWIEVALATGGICVFTVWGPYSETWKNNVFAYSVNRILNIVGVRDVKDLAGKPIVAIVQDSIIIGIADFMDPDNKFITQEEDLYQTFRV